MSQTEKRFGTVALSRLLPRVAGEAMRRRGFTESAIVTRWPEIVGPDVARDTAPDRLRFPQGKTRGGTLHVRVDGAAALEVQHRAPVIVERINTFFGYGAVARLALVQGPLPPAPEPRRPPAPAPLDPEAEARLEAELAGLEDGPLRGALARLGRAVRGHTAQR